MPVESDRASARLRKTSIFAGVGAATFALDFACLLLSRPQGGVAAIWPSDGLALGLMLAAGPNGPWSVLAASFAGVVAADLAWGDSLSNALILAAANLIGVVFTFVAMRAVSRRPDLRRARDLVLLLLLGSVAATLSAGIASAWLAASAGADAPAIFRSWLLPDLLGYAIVAPLAHALMVRKPPLSSGHSWRGAAALGAFCILTLAVFGQRQYPLLFLVPLGLFVVAYFAELQGSVLAVMLTAVTAVGASALHRGPIALVVGPPSLQLLILQVFLASLTVAILPISAAMAERRELAASLAAARAAAEAAAIERSAMLADLSHELRTPLASVLGFASLLRDTPELTGEARRLAEGVTIAGEGLLAAIENVLTFSTLESGAAAQLRATSPIALADDVLLLFRAEADAKALTLSVEALPAMPDEAILDAGRLRQILLNLVGNAVKYTVTGGVTITIGPAAAGGLRFEVLDTGPGLPREQVGRIFERFSRLDDGATPQRGAGLGLAIAKALVEGAGGEIGVRTPSCGGCCFWFTTPTSEAETVRDESRRALIADDVAVGRELMRRSLEPLGFRIAEAVSGEAAARRAVSEAFDLVMLDLDTPTSDGVAAAGQVRADASASRGAMMLAVSARPLTPALSARLTGAGFNGFLPKPFTASSLAQLVAARWPEAAAAAV
jgi:signal transduction histidine kinase/CheY-like chemotaxis protein